ncbi:MAG: tetratricopeptide repeat protein [Clostridiales bacterium]|nr:tetratricopeptide repeat protein [Clostridiales bacterium]
MPDVKLCPLRWGGHFFASFAFFLAQGGKYDILRIVIENLLCVGGVGMVDFLNWVKENVPGPFMWVFIVVIILGALLVWFLTNGEKAASTYNKIKAWKTRKAKPLTKGPARVRGKLQFRDELVKETSKQIKKAKKTKQNKFLLHGFGGVGKTAVATALYDALEPSCQQIGWVECRESSSLRDSLLAAIDTGSGNKTAEERFAEIERLLLDATGETILFLDNVDRYDPLLRDLTRYNVTLVVTSRMEQVDGYIPILIPQLAEDKCVELFRAYCAQTLTEQDEPATRELVRLVSCHTLSVELLAKGLPAGMNLPEYLERLKAEGFGFPGLKFRTGHDEEIGTITDHLKKLFDMARLGGEQTRVMQNLALMADNRTLPFEVRDWIGCEENTLNELANTGWLTQTEDGYEVHPIVRKVVLLGGVPLSAVEHYLNFVAYKPYFQDGEDYRAVQFKLGIVESGLARVEDRMEKGADTAALYNKLGVVYIDQGQYVQAEMCCQKALNIYHKMPGENHPGMADSYSNLGVVYSRQAKYTEAERCFLKELKIRRKVPEERDMLEDEAPDTVGSYNNLGNAYRRQGEYVQAEKCYREALRIRRNALAARNMLEEKDPDTAIIYSNLGNVYRNQGKDTQAKKCYQNALDIRLKVLGEEHPDTANSYNNLGNVYRRQGWYAQAEEYHRTALNIRLKVLGEEHPDTANSYNNLGVACEDQNRYDEAVEQYLHAWRIWQKTLGPEHPSTKLAESNLRSVFPHTDHGDEDFDTWLSRQWRALGEEHSDTANSYNNPGVVYDDQGQYDQVEACHQKALEIRLKVLGENHPDTAMSYNNLGVVYENQKRFDEAMEQCLHAWRILERVLGPEHPRTETVKNNLRRVFPHIAHGDEDFETWLSRQQKA